MCYKCHDGMLTTGVHGFVVNPTTEGMILLLPDNACSPRQAVNDMVELSATFWIFELVCAACANAMYGCYLELCMHKSSGC